MKIKKTTHTEPTQNTYSRNGTEQKGRKEIETEKADIDCSSGISGNNLYRMLSPSERDRKPLSSRRICISSSGRGGAELAGMPMGGVTIGSANIFVGIPPTSEEFFNFFPNGVGTYLSNSNPKSE